MKKLISICVAFSLALAGVVAAAPANAAVKCSASKAAGRSPKAPGTPQDRLKTFPASFTIKTNCGNIVFAPLGESAPVTVTSFSYLVSKKYFDKTICHRLTTSGIFVLQCGDPTATGGGPSFYTYKDENLPTKTANNYPAGTVAMANSGAATNFSQFFLVYKDTTLPPNYTIWGKITKGLDVVQYIAKQGIGPKKGDGSPATPGDAMPKKTVEVISIR